MNLIPEVAKLLGVEIGEEFDIILENCTPSSYGPYKFTEGGLESCCMTPFNEYIPPLIKGDYTIRKLPFKPKQEEIYWYWSISNNKAYNCRFDKEYTNDLIFWKIGNCFRTKEEAEIKGKELMEKIMKEYENE